MFSLLANLPQKIAVSSKSQSAYKYKYKYKYKYIITLIADSDLHLEAPGLRCLWGNGPVIKFRFIALHNVHDIDDGDV